MENPWGIENQQPPEPVADPVRLGTAHVNLIASTVILVVTIVLYLVDYTSAWALHVGGYVILVGLFGIFGCGWIVRAAESRVRQCIQRHVTIEVDRATRQLAERLEHTIRTAPPTVTYLPGRVRTEASRTVAVGTETTTTMPTGLDPDTIAAVHTINQRLHSTDRPASRPS